jgi:hypothetical protein
MSDGSYLTRERFSNLQRAALRGAEAIASIIDFTEHSSDADLKSLITACYTWKAALLSVRAATLPSGFRTDGGRPLTTEPAPWYAAPAAPPIIRENATMSTHLLG